MVAAAADHDVIVMSAAVADFRPKVAADGKLKKRDGIPEIVLEPTPDILAGLGAAKRSRTGPGRIRRRDRRSARECHGEAALEAPRPDRRERRECATGWLRSRHKRGYAVAARRGACRDRPRIEARCRSGRHRHHHRHHVSIRSRTSTGHCMSTYTFTSESVTEGHPDKMADQVSDSDSRRDPHRGSRRTCRLRDPADHRSVRDRRRDHHVGIRRHPQDRPRDDQRHRLRQRALRLRRQHLRRHRLDRRAEPRHRPGRRCQRGGPVGPLRRGHASTCRVPATRG